MLHRTRFALAALTAAALLAGSARAAATRTNDLTAGMKKGTPELKSVGAMAFGPGGILFVGDPVGATIYAVDTGDNPKQAATGKLSVKGFDEKVASLLGTEAKALRVIDLEVNPASGKAYLSVMRGRGADATPVIIRVDRKGDVKEFSLKDVKHSKVELPNAPDPSARTRMGPARQFSITKLAYAKGKLYVSGLSNEEWKSTLRAIPFPFKKADKGTSVQIWHGAHGKFETEAPIRTFIPFDIDGKSHLLAAYTCTPLVKFSVSDLKPGEKLKGTTVAELGNMNSPIDMIVYEKNGKKYLLIANNRRGVMKVTTDNINKVEPVTDHITGGGKAGLKYETIKSLKGVEQLDKLDKEHALVLIRNADKGLDLETVELP
jgi:hypothetical protein